MHDRNRIVVFSGGSAANHLVDTFTTLAQAKQARLDYVIPISDNGGSTSELIRVLGGPGIGDLRSRLVRLIPEDRTDAETIAIRAFFNHRLSSDGDCARLEWLDIVEARHALWQGMSSAKKELIRSFLNLLNMEIVKRVRPSSVFCFEKASVGNMFLTGARLFSGSLDSAIYLLHSICMIPDHVQVLPAISSNFSHHICAGLANGDTIAGQNSISHPGLPPALHSLPITPGIDAERPSLELSTHDTIEDANWPGSLPVLRKQYINFSKLQEMDDLPARIERIWYINPYGQEIRPSANRRVIDSITSSQALIYSIGSLYTSIIPCLILRGVGEAIAFGGAREKILILNGSLDREVGPSSCPLTALDFVRAIGRACHESRGVFDRAPDLHELKLYVTHVVYVEGPGTPEVSKAELARIGIETVRVYGRRAPLGEQGSRYDLKALGQTLDAIISRRAGRADVSRRNTISLKN